MSDWLATIEIAAERLEFASFRLIRSRRTGGVSWEPWRRPHGLPRASEASLELKDQRVDQTLRVQVSVAGDFLEAAAGRALLIGELLDRWGLQSCSPAL